MLHSTRDTIASISASSSSVRRHPAAATFDLTCSGEVAPAITETTAVGSAYMAGLATGFWESKEEVAETWKLQRRYDPQMGEQERDRLHGLWLKAVERAKGWEGVEQEAEA